MSLTGIFLRSHAEWSAKGESYEELLQRLRKNEATTLARLRGIPDVERNRGVARHVIGIERWGAQRLRTLLGEPLVMDEYDGYAPSNDLSIAELTSEFQETRSATIALVDELRRQGIAPSATVKHNELGDLSVGGWIVYISSHTSRETLVLLQRKEGKAA